MEICNTFYTQFAKNVFSQNGEDGVLWEILTRLGVQKNGWVAEVGAWDGKHLSNTFALVRDHGFKAVYIEGDPTKYRDLLQTVSEHPPGTIHPVCRRLEIDGKNGGSLQSILQTTPIPYDFTLLSIDIDSFDYWAWKKLELYRPIVVVIEINSSISPVEWKVFGEKGHADGTSFLPTLLLGYEKGYRFVCHTGNMIFVRRDRADKLGLPPDHNPFENFRFNWIMQS
jgi:hypothetical protein